MVMSIGLGGSRITLERRLGVSKPFPYKKGSGGH